MKHKRLYIIILALWSLCAALLRFCNLGSAVDELGLFISGHPSTILLVTISGIAVAMLLGLSWRSPGRGTDHTVLTYGPISTGLSMAAGAILLLGVVLETQWAALDVWNAILLILGLSAGGAMVLLAKQRQSGKSVPMCALLPVLYLLFDLIFLFKAWSTDPVILDYCFQLAALIFSLLGFYGSAGFCFDLGHSRKTLFYCACGIFFSAIAMADGLHEASLGAIFSDLGRILWLIPIVLCLLRPRQAPSPEAPTDKVETNR